MSQNNTWVFQRRVKLPQDSPNGGEGNSEIGVRGGESINGSVFHSTHLTRRSDRGNVSQRLSSGEGQERDGYSSSEDSSDEERPGAYALSRNRPGSIVNREWDPTAPEPETELAEETRPVDDSSPDAIWCIPENEIIPEKKRNKIQWRMVLLLTGFLFIGAIVIVIARKLMQKSTSVGMASTCDQILHNATTSNPFLQCECFQSMKVIDDYTREVYDTIKSYNGIAKGLESDLQIESCTSSNIALLWTAWQMTEKQHVDLNSASEKITNRFVLASLYASWSGPKWKQQANWISNESECSWYGVACGDNGEIIALSLARNAMEGTLDTKLGLLQDLKSLDITENEIKGPVPPAIWALPELGELLGLSCLDFFWINPYAKPHVHIFSKTICGLVPIDSTEVSQSIWDWACLR